CTNVLSHGDRLCATTLPPPRATLFPYTTLFRSGYSATERDPPRGGSCRIPTGGSTMPYPELMVAPMRRELTRLGIEELRTPEEVDRKSTRLNSSHVKISYAVFCLKKKNDA